jgi:hypothetical protein
MYCTHRAHPPSLFSFNIRDYIEEGKVSSSAPEAHREEFVLSVATRDRLQLMLPYLEKDIVDLVRNAKPLLDIFLAINGELNQDLLVILSPLLLLKARPPRSSKRGRG